MPKQARVLLAAALLMAGVVSLFASASPDGLDRILIDLHISADEGLRAAPLPEYQVPGVSRPWLSGSLAGLAGTVLALGAAWGLLRLLAKAGAGNAGSGVGKAGKDGR